MMPALVFEGVKVRFGRVTVVDDLSLAVPTGQKIALLGINGSGKTTLLSAAAGLVAHEGEIRVNGIRLDRDHLSQVRHELGFLFNVPEDQLLFPTVIDDVAFGLIRRGISGDEARVRARATLARLGADQLADQATYHLSHGQKLRVALAGALVTDPPVVLLDEPSAGLDVPAKYRLAACLREMDAALLVATHDLDFASRFCQGFAMMERGRLAEVGTDFHSVAKRWAGGRQGA